MVTQHILLFTDPWPVTGGRLARGVSRYARRKANWSVEIRAQWDPHLADTPEARSAQGMIFKGLLPTLIPAVAALGLPSVFALASGDMAASLPPHAGLITLDEHLIGQVGARHLLQLGHSTLAFCGIASWWSLGREAGFLAEVKAQGKRALTLPSQEAGEHTLDVGRVADWIRTLPLPTAVMACNDAIGRTIILACQQVYLRVPEDIAVLGVNDDDLICDFSPVPLSSIDTNLELLGYEAAVQLDELMFGGQPQSPRFIASPKVIARRSTDTLAISDPDVAAAIRFIRAYAHEGIEIEQVAAHLVTSRSSLERRFRKVLGRTPGHEIRSARLAHALQLLTETHMSISQIALASGYSDQPHFTREFTHFIGTPPLRYRREQQRAPRQL